MSRILRLAARRQLLLVQRFHPESQLLLNSNRCQSTSLRTPTRNGLARVAYRNTPKDSSFASSENTTSNRTSETSRKMLSLQKSMSSLLSSYQAELFNEESANEHGTATDASKLFAQTGTLHLKCRNDTDKIEWSHIQDTEPVFRDLCRVIQQLISIASLLESPQGSFAEQLLRALILLLSDRQDLVQAFEPKEFISSKSVTSVTSSVVNWLNNIFVRSPGETENKTEEEPNRSNVHTHVSVSPRKRHFGEVIAAIFQEVAIDETDQHILRDRAARLESLLELSKGMNLHIKSILLVIRAQEAIGTLEKAEKAEQIWRDHDPDVPSPELLQAVLRAYDSAAVNEGDRRSRSKAAKRAEWLVLERWGKDKKPDFASKSRSFAIALQALSNAGARAVPERCERAENLIIKCLGKRAFSRLYTPDVEETTGVNMLSRADMHLLQPLVAIYASQKDPKRLQQARQILRSMEIQHQLRHKGAKRGNQGRRKEGYDPVDSADELPSLETYQSMLVGIRNYTFTEAETPELLELAKYASGLLDNMAAISVTPDEDTFDRLLKIWVRVMSIDSGEYAEEILSYMQLREMYDPDCHVSAETYQQVLRCWKLSATELHPQAAERANQLLRFMEAQSGIHGRLPCRAGYPSRDTSRTVYNDKVRPDIGIYNLVIRVCSNVRCDSSRERALVIALDVHKRLCQAALEPNSDTYTNLFLCIAKQLPSDSPRRLEFTSDILTSATTNGKVDSSVLNALKAVDNKLHKEFQSDGKRRTHEIL